MASHRSWAITGALMLALGATSAHADEATIAVAANFTSTMKALVQDFKQQSGDTIKVSYGSTGKLYAQIANGAPFDAFLSADQARPAKAVTEGFGIQGSQFTYAAGLLALWSLTPLQSQDAKAVLAGDYAHLSIANPVTAPYGLAAQQVLTQYGLWDSTASKRVQGDNITQAYQFVSSGVADIGLVALSQVRAGQNQGYSIVIDSHAYQPILQDAVLLKHGEHNKAASAFLAFLKTPKAKLTILNAGYQ